MNSELLMPVSLMAFSFFFYSAAADTSGRELHKHPSDNLCDYSVHYIRTYLRLAGGLIPETLQAGAETMRPFIRQKTEPQHF